MIIIEIILGLVMIVILLKTIYFDDWIDERFKSYAIVTLGGGIIAFIEGHWIIGIILCVIALILLGFGEENKYKKAIRGSKILGTLAIASLICAIVTFYIGRWGWGIIFSIATVLLAILWVAYHFFRLVGEVVQDVVELIKVVINEIINRRTVKDAVRQKCPGALKTQILEAKKRAITVGIWGKNNQKQNMEISSDCGVDYDEIYEGETIDLRA